MSLPRVVLSMNGGLIQDAFSTDPTIELIVVDWDTEDCDPDLDDLIEVVTEDGRTNWAIVGLQPVRPIGELKGTDTQAALARAGL